MPVWPGSGSLWVMGCGNMGGALLRRWLECGLEPERVTVIDLAPQRIEGVRWVASLPDGQPEFLMLGVKPQTLAEVAAILAPAVGPGTTLLSILAGVECDTLRKHFPNAGAIVRSMPNMPVALGKGVTGLFTQDSAARDSVDAAFAVTGERVWIEDESLFHAIVALSGSGPAFVYRIIGAMAQGAVDLGLPKSQAIRLAASMIEGAAAASLASGEDPAELARQVTSPGGTTAEGLAVLDKDGALTALIAKTMRATARRSEELAKAARE